MRDFDPNSFNILSKEELIERILELYGRERELRHWTTHLENVNNELRGRIDSLSFRIETLKPVVTMVFHLLNRLSEFYDSSVLPDELQVDLGKINEIMYNL